MLKVYNDHLLVELQKSEWATADVAGEQEDPKAGSGIVVKAPKLEDILYLSSYTWIAEETVVNEGLLTDIHAKMQKLVGKKVYFEKRADLGNTVEHDGKTYATIKLSKITAVEGK